jgi:hypothetical protein
MWEWLFAIGYLVAGGLLLAWSIFVRLSGPIVAEEVAAVRFCWGTVYFLINLAAIVGIYFVSFASRGSPVLYWVLAFGIVGCLCAVVATWRFLASMANTAED